MRSPTREWPEKYTTNNNKTHTIHLPQLTAGSVLILHVDTAKHTVVKDESVQESEELNMVSVVWSEGFCGEQVLQ